MLCGCLDQGLFLTGGTPVLHPSEGSSGRNSVVHSLSVTLSNHTILGNPSYNDPCPKDHPSYDRQTWPIGWPTCRPGFPEMCSLASGPYLESASIWRSVSALTNRRLSALRRNSSSRAS